MTLSQETREAVDEALALYDADDEPLLAQVTACGQALHRVRNEDDRALLAERQAPTPTDDLFESFEEWSADDGHDPAVARLLRTDPYAARIIWSDARALAEPHRQPPAPSGMTPEALAERIDSILGWRHLRKYAGMSTEWMDAVRDAIAAAASPVVGQAPTPCGNTIAPSKNGGEWGACPLPDGRADGSE